MRLGDAQRRIIAAGRDRGRRALAVGCHVGDWDQCEALVVRAVGELGGLDVLVNNAGIAPVPPSLAGITEELFDKTLAGWLGTHRAVLIAVQGPAGSAPVVGSVGDM